MGFAFEGAYHNYEAKLSDNEILAGHLIHSILHLAAQTPNRISYHKDMSLQEFYTANQNFLFSVCVRYEKLRGYTIGPSAVRNGIRWYLERMKHIESH